MSARVIPMNRELRATRAALRELGPETTAAELASRTLLHTVTVRRCLCELEASGQASRKVRPGIRSHLWSVAS